MRESSIAFSPYKKTHRPTPSQQSNTLSDLSCETLASDILESETSETEAAGEALENRSEIVFIRKYMKSLYTWYPTRHSIWYKPWHLSFGHINFTASTMTLYPVSNLKLLGHFSSTRIQKIEWVEIFFKSFILTKYRLLLLISYVIISNVANTC